MKLLTKQYNITSLEIAGHNGYFDEDGNYQHSLNEDNVQIKPSEPQYKITYKDDQDNEFNWLLNSQELEVE
jgi:hypothetical protein